MNAVIKTVRNDQIRPLLAKASKLIKDYTAILAFEDGRVGSGVFVNTGGVEGILTAHHVAKVVFEVPEFALCIADHVHELWRKSAHMQHIVIGDSSGNPEPKDGPDLSFIRIRDSNLLGILRSLKSFCFLESQKTRFFDSPLNLMHWAIAGSPHEFLVPIKPRGKDGPLSKLTNFVGDADFVSRMQRKGFDYVELAITSGQADFPKSYAGVSGGGLWLIPLEVDPNEDLKTIGHAAPVLAGIAFYQSEPENGQRIITGHGFDSIYSRVTQSLEGESG
jgi:hypothetical protein